MGTRTFDAKYALIGEDLIIKENVRIHLNQNNKIIDIEEINNVNNKFLLIPGFFNSHCHSGDFGLYNKFPSGLNLAQLVGDNSVKSNYLNTMTYNELSDNIFKFAKNGIKNYITLYCDFREGGIIGTQPYLDSANMNLINFNFKQLNIDNINVTILSRPESLEEAKILSNNFGLGIRDIYYYPIDDLIEFVNIYATNNKPIQIHVSEDLEKRNAWLNDTGETDLIWAAKNLSPELLIHTNHAEQYEYQFLKEQNLPISICASSNNITKTKEIDWQGLQEIDFPTKLINLGSDNAMFSQNEIRNEIKNIQLKFNLDSTDLLKISMLPDKIPSLNLVHNIEIGKFFRGTFVNVKKSITNHNDVISHILD